MDAQVSASDTKNARALGHLLAEPDSGELSGLDTA